ncbi:MAG: hypothetical protein OSB47_05810 [Pirellulaceae bacterium]|nr:hypothetical protein [Pirellulaceae bacterium]
MTKTKTFTLLVLFMSCASWSFAAKPFPAENARQAKKTSVHQRAVSMLPSKVDQQSSVIIGDNHFIIIDDNHCQPKAQRGGEVWLGPLGGDGVFLGPLGGDGVFSALVDRIVTGQLSNVGKLNEDFNLVLSPGDLLSMEKQGLKTGDIEVLGILIILSRQVGDLFWWTLDGSNL